MKSFEVRPIQNENELKEAHLIWEEVFPEDRCFFNERLMLDDHYSFETTWIAKVDGKIAASTQIFPYYFRFGKATFKVGGLANVATRPKYRGRYLAQTILRRQIIWMEQNNFDFSHLATGINDFYQTLGWHTLPDQTYVLPITKLNIEPPRSYKVSEMIEEDLPAIKSLYDYFSEQKIGLYMRSLNYWKKQLNREYNRPKHFLVAKQGKKIVSYVRYDVIENKIMIIESCYDKNHKPSLLDILQQIISMHQNVDEIQIHFAGDHFLTQLLTASGAKEILRDHYMWRVIQKNKILNALKPAFLKNIPESEINILFQCGHEDYLISRKGETIHLHKPVESLSYDRLIKCTTNDFITLFFRGAKAAPHVKYAHHLFPEKNDYYFWDTDAF